MPLPEPNSFPLPGTVNAHIAGDALLDILSATARSLDATFAHVLADVGINLPRFLVLEQLAAAPSEGLMQAALAARLEQAESSLSTLVERMRESGLVDRHRCGDDRRRCYIRLTESGWTVHDAARAVRRRLAGQICREVSPHAAPVVHHVLRNLQIALQQRGGGTNGHRPLALRIDGAESASPRNDAGASKGGTCDSAPRTAPRSEGVDA